MDIRWMEKNNFQKLLVRGDKKKQSKNMERRKTWGLKKMK
jgi:hypothetical protein